MNSFAVYVWLVLICQGPSPTPDFLYAYTRFLDTVGKKNYREQIGWLHYKSVNANLIRTRLLFISNQGALPFSEIKVSSHLCPLVSETPIFSYSTLSLIQQISLFHKKRWKP